MKSKLPTMVNALVVADPTPGLLIVKIYPVPGLLMERFENVATPFTALTGLVPLRVAPAVPVVIVAVTGLVKSENTACDPSSIKLEVRLKVFAGAVLAGGCVVTVRCVQNSRMRLLLKSAT